MKFKVGYIPLFEPSSIAGDSSAIFLPCSDSCGCNIRNELISAGKLVGRDAPIAPQVEFEPQYDDDGNQTLIQTATGIRSATYNGEDANVSANSLAQPKVE